MVAIYQTGTEHARPSRVRRYYHPHLVMADRGGTLHPHGRMRVSA